MKKRGVVIIVAVAILIGGIVAGVSYATTGDQTLQLPEPKGYSPEEIDENTPPEVVEEFKRAGLIDEFGKPIPQPQKPSLTEEERAWAKGIALSDSRVRELIEGKNYEVVIGLIHSSFEKTGAVVVINFDKSYDIEYDWPWMEPIEGAQKPSDYRQSIRHSKQTVRSLDIMIFFDRGEVAAIIPGSRSS